MQTIDFELDRDFVELNQLLKLTGLCDSGGAGKQLVASGAVRVDGATELRKTAKIRAGQRVGLGDVEIRVVGV
ncbi:MAG: RNA-binding S4 domain-containing protein [Thermomonas sp.]|uniref:RNA-binding S4 domain-containing protein n=1 Tax=Thermomonas sp. TaxID=1971895 RepID=UPI0039E5F869